MATQLIAALWNNWLIVAFIATMLWALVNLIDIYFVNGIYENEYDGTIISGIFQLAPWILFPWLGFTLPDKEAVFLATTGGFLYVVSTFFYFKALFVVKDVAAVELLWSLSIIAVPVLAFLFAGEQLSLVQWIGISTAFIGAAILSFDKGLRSKTSFRLLMIMLGAVIFLSFSMIIVGAAYKKTDFWTGFLLFSLGSFIGALFFWLVRFMAHNIAGKSIFTLSRKYFRVFLFAEALAVSGVVFLQRAINTGPSVSFVTVIGSFQPVFILFFSGLIVFVYSIMLKKDHSAIQRIYREQLQGIKVKILAIIIMVTGVYLIS